MTTELRAPATDEEWVAYHTIRRHVLFELRGNGSAYDPNHPDDRRPGHYPFVLWVDDTPVGVIRVDVDDDVAMFRRVAIRDDLQHRGYGRRMLGAAQEFARRQSCTRIDSHVDRDAIVFYERCGFFRVDSSKSAGAVLMRKALAMIRPANAGDADALGAVHVASWRTTYPGIVDQQYIDSLSVEDRTTAWRRRLADDSPTAIDILVAELPERGVVGFASGGRIREPEPGFDAELYAIYLLADVQRGGIGRQLVRAWGARAVDRGFHSAVVRVLAANPACAFYERLGAQRIKEAELTIAGREYPEVWYGWTDLGALAT